MKAGHWPQQRQEGGEALAGEHGPTVEADVDRKRIPAWDSDVTSAQGGVFKVVVEVQALTLFAGRFQTLGLMVGANGHGGAGFDGGQYGN